VTAILIGLWVPVAAIVIALAAAHVTAGAVLVGVVGFIAALLMTIWISVRLTIAVPAVVLEGARPVAALRRSWQLVGGSWWRVFGITLLAGIVVAIIGGILQIPFTIVGLIVGGGGGSLTTMFSSTATVTAPTILSVVIGAVGSIVAATYTDMRIRKEGLDLALHQASQQQALTGDEFSSLWRPGLQGPGQFPAAGSGPGSGQGPAGGQGWGQAPPA
jgi:hypothetical protein